MTKYCNSYWYAFLHVVVSAGEVWLDEEAGLDAFSDAGVDGGEETHSANDQHDQIDSEP